MRTLLFRVPNRGTSQQPDIDMELDLVIKNGMVITAADSFLADVGILDGKIARIGLDFQARRVIDAQGKFVLPGGVDPHVHLQMPQGEFTSSDNFESGTIAAVCGEAPQRSLISWSQKRMSLC